MGRCSLRCRQLALRLTLGEEWGGSVPVATPDSVHRLTLSLTLRLIIFSHIDLDLTFGLYYV